jgi:hypothetical protein
MRGDEPGAKFEKEGFDLAGCNAHSPEHVNVPSVAKASEFNTLTNLKYFRGQIALTT